MSRAQRHGVPQERGGVQYELIMIQPIGNLSTRCWFSANAAAGLGIWTLATAFLVSAQEGKGKPVSKTLTITEGDLQVVLRDNAQSPAVLSGLASLFHAKDAPEFSAFDSANSAAGVGLNFEHIISGHRNPNNSFTPRKGKFALEPLPDARSARLVRKKEDDPWAVSSTLKYTVTKPHYIDMDFRCTPHDKTLFGKRGYAILFFANYMNDVEDVALHFRGVEGPRQKEKWIKADAPKSHADWNQGGTYRSRPAADLEYDADHNFKLNSWSYDYPRFTRPFYYGRAGKGMVFLLMFDKMYSAEEEIRFSLFKFKLPKAPRPAWDFQYVLHSITVGKEYGFKARLVWKKFISPEDCLKEYDAWVASLGKAR